MVEPVVPTYSTIRYERDDRVAIVTLARPEVRNAISPAMQAELEHAFVRADDDRRVRVVVLRGDGPALFCRYALPGSGFTPFAAGPRPGGGRPTPVAHQPCGPEEGR